MAAPGALATLDDDAVIERIAAGEYQSHIARQLAVAPQSLHERISKHPNYRAALKARNIGKLDNAQQACEELPDLARERFRAAAWRAERECPDEWGAKNNVINIGAEGPMTVQIVNFALSSPPIDATHKQLKDE